MDREEYIQRATESFNRYIEAFRSYDDHEKNAYEKLTILKGKLLESLEEKFRFIPLGIGFEVDEEEEEIDLSKILSEDTRGYN